MKKTDNLKAKVLNPAGLVDYAAGSIVSKTLIDRKAGTLTGEMVIMPANVPHALKAGHKFKMLLTMIRGK